MNQPKTEGNKIILIIIFKLLLSSFNSNNLKSENISISPLTHCIQVDSFFVMFWTSPFIILGMVGSVLSLIFYFW